MAKIKLRAFPTFVLRTPLFPLSALDDPERTMQQPCFREALPRLARSLYLHRRQDGGCGGEGRRGGSEILPARLLAAVRPSVSLPAARRALRFLDADRRCGAYRRTAYYTARHAVPLRADPADRTARSGPPAAPPLPERYALRDRRTVPLHRVFPPGQEDGASDGFGRDHSRTDGRVCAGARRRDVRHAGRKPRRRRDHTRGGRSLHRRTDRLLPAYYGAGSGYRRR